MKKVITILLLATFSSCTPTFEDTFNSKELVSSKNEKIYINSLNWGVNDDYQMTIVSSNKNKIKNRLDTVGVIKGFEPFIYSFKNDTLTLIFDGAVSYSINEKFKTIGVKYIILNKQDFKKIRNLAYENDDYYAIPIRK